ncbi:MAG: glutaredoxin 3 [Pseudomonadota bacterium]
MSAKVEIYTIPTCPYCNLAKALLKEKNVDYQEIDVAGDNDLRAKMVERAGGRRTVPQIFINDQHIGGNDDLQALNRDGKLDSLLAG